MTTNEDITKLQGAYCKILDQMVGVKPVFRANTRLNAVLRGESEKYCHEKFYEVDHGILSFTQFEQEMRLRYGDEAIETMTRIMSMIGGR